jgi:leucyl aminopeptidase
MPIAHRTPSITASSQTPYEAATDLAVIAIFEDDQPADNPALHDLTAGELQRARERGEFKGKLGDQVVMALGTGRRVLVLGAGTRQALTTAVVRRVSTIAGLAARNRGAARLTLGGWDRMALVLGGEGVTKAPLAVAQAAAEGVVLANFDGGNYKTDDSRRPFVESVELAGYRQDSDAAAVDAAIARGRILGEASNIARELANEPGNALTPRVFAERAREIAQGAGVAVEILDEEQIAGLKMGLLLGVARGSSEPPRLVVLRHEPANVVPGPVLGLVGKGITFDTGGISIKPAENMDKMKDDMSGGAAVIAAMAALARLNAPIRVIGVIPMTENMPGGRAVKPGDILTGAEGKTVEIINTDAEGRLVLGDGLWYARQLGATHLVDVATLTGACVVALGKTTSGLFGTPEGWVETVRQASDRAGDRSWPMPIFDDYKEQLKSEIADFTNTGGRAAGAITAALFLKEFTGDLPWVHIDIAGTAWAEEAKPYQPKGATGVAVRTLAELALDAASWGKLASGS